MKTGLTKKQKTTELYFNAKDPIYPCPNREQTWF